MSKHKKILIIIAVFIFCSNFVYAQDLKVAAAANLQSVLPELTELFTKQSGVKVKTITGSSGKLVAQIENGAPFDVFMSADMKYPQALYREKLTTGEPKVYAQGILVLWTAKSMDLSSGVAILSDPSIKKVAVANPQLAPYGREAVNALKFYKIYEQVNSKLVYGESISQTNDFIVSQSADIGFTSKSTVLSPNLKEKGTWIEVPAESYQRIAQGVVVIKKSNELSNAQKFYDFLFSSEAKDIFKKYGYNLD